MSWPHAVGSLERAALMDRLVTKTGGVRSEATIQADIRMLLLDPELGLTEDNLDVHLEAQVGEQRRIDIEVGCTVIEVKRSLHSPTVIAAAVHQLAGYVATRAAERGQRYVGILTDGLLWIAFHEVEDELREATRHTAVAGAIGASALLRWLEGVLATKQAIPPTPQEIADRLGATSSSHALDYFTLAALYRDSRDLPTVVLKRDLWASLLRSALGTQFTNSDELFLEHTLLVNSAEIIAHLVLGLDVQQLSPSTLLSGDQFAVAGLHGVVDRDFFDWVIEVPGGDGFITALARRLARFDWSKVEHDVLKVLYEEVISAETRKLLGEYYTPDWLANRVVSEVVTDPLHQRVLDPSCGSGTFVFYAVRRFLDAADDAGMTLKDSMALVSSQVMGIDLHPVAVALARVTYLLALGRDRLNATGRGTLSVPIYLGDSLGWTQHEDDILSVGYLVIPTETGEHLLLGELRFAEHLLTDSANFDALVESLVDESGRAAGKSTNRLSEGAIRRLAIAAADLPGLNTNFARLKELHEAERNHIWSYYIRNVARPAWLAREENRVDVLIGNPPWLSYRHMTTTMQQRFKSMSQARGFWHNETTATHQDLAGLFVARAVEQYLKEGGSMAFVVPNSVVDREYWAGFRRGQFEHANVRFRPSWDLRRMRPHLFPRGSAVIFATRDPKASPMPSTALIWSGRAPQRHLTIDAAGQLRQVMGELSIGNDDDERSVYSARFSQGANLVPRMMFRVEPVAATALGVQAGSVSVRSKRSVSEKKPWKDLADLIGTVETEFVWPTVLGEQIIPYRMLPVEDFVIPLTSRGDILTGEDPRIDAYPGLAKWTRAAESMWTEHRQSKMTLAQQIDHMRKLTHQMPPAAIRVVYAKAGMHVAAALVIDPRAVIDHKLYWAAVASQAEGRYLVGILNSPALTDLVRPLMSYGKDERDIDKHVWKLPIPAYDRTNATHVEIARLSGHLAEEIADQTFTTDNFVTIRRTLRKFLISSKAGRELNELIIQLLNIDAPAEVAVSEDGDQIQSRLIRTTSGPLDLEPTALEVDVDCEFDRLGRVYLWGALVTRQGESEPTYHSFASSETGDERAVTHTFHSWLAELLETAVTAGHSVRWFHYSQIEPRQLHRIMGSEIGSIMQYATDLLTDVIRPNFYAPNGYGLKRLAQEVGAAWRTTGASGADTLKWIEEARDGDTSRWETLLDYNEDDTRATRTLRRSLAESKSFSGT